MTPTRPYAFYYGSAMRRSRTRSRVFRGWQQRKAQEQTHDSNQSPQVLPAGDAPLRAGVEMGAGTRIHNDGGNAAVSGADNAQGE